MEKLRFIKVVTIKPGSRVSQDQRFKRDLWILSFRGEETGDEYRKGFYRKPGQGLLAEIPTISDHEYLNSIKYRDLV